RGGWASLDPTRALGSVVALLKSGEARPRDGGGRRPRWAVPPCPPTPPPVTVLGLRMRARSRERAEAQWVRLLGAEASESASGVVIYRWPGSPTRIGVEVAPTRDEGPVAIELASERAIALPAGPHPVLGAVFTAH